MSKQDLIVKRLYICVNHLLIQMPATHNELMTMSKQGIIIHCPFIMICLF